MKKKKLLLLILVLTFILSFNGISTKANNGVLYKTYTEDHSHRLIPTQDAYIPIAIYTQFGDITLKNPEDIFIDEDESLYIADTGNKQILIIDKGYTNIRTIGKDVLIKPTGLFVDKDKNIYVADMEASLVYKFSPTGEVLFTYGKPTEPMFGTKTPYRPIKVTVDYRGNLYIISEGTYNGIIQLNSKGEFLGFFGANTSKVDLRTIIIKSIFPKNVYERFITVNPVTPTNITIDDQGRVYTVTRGTFGDAIKRHNISGVNKMRTDLNDTNAFNAISIGPIGNIYTVADDGYVREYDAEGNLLFLFGGKDERGYFKGLFNNPVAIASDKGFNLYVIDRAKSELHVFIRTDFAKLVHEAVALYQEGLYSESKEPWQLVLEANNMFDLAHKGIGLAYFKQEMYREALEEFRIAGYRQGYSDSFWELRNDWLMRNLSIILIIFASLYLFSVINRYTLKVHPIKSGIKYIKTQLNKYRISRELLFVTYVMKNPADAYYGIKREGKVSILSTLILCLVLYIEKIFAIYYTGFVFNYNDLYRVSLVKEAITLFAPLVLFICANYLVCAINDGEGKFTVVFKATIYSLMPLILFWPVVVILSNVLTLNEAFIYQAAMTVLYAYTGILLFIMIKEIHNYSLWETIKIILITAFTMIVMLVSYYLLNGLVQQVINFIIQIISEVGLRV